MKNIKNILIVSSKCNPPIQTPRAFRTAELVKEFSRRGFAVTLLIEDVGFNYAKFSRIHGVSIKHYEKLHWTKNIFGKNTSTYVKLANRIINEVLMRLFRYPQIEYYFRIKQVLKNENDYDLMISIASPHPIHWGCTAAVKKNKALTKKWIADCGDPFMGESTDRFSKIFYFKYIEKWFCRTADYISVPVEGAINGYYKEFHQKISVIPQGFDLNSIKLSETKIQNSAPTFAYAGYLMKRIRDPKPLLDYLVSKEIDFKLILYSEGNFIVNEIKSLYGEKVEVRPYIKREELIYELSKMDFLINFDNGTNIQMPSKLIDYSLTGLPVLNILPGEIVETNIIDEFMRGDYSNRLKLPDISNYDIQNVVDKFLRLAEKN